MIKVNDKIKFEDKYNRILAGTILYTNYTLPYGGPIVDNVITDLTGLIKVLSEEGINTIIDKEQII